MKLMATCNCLPHAGKECRLKIRCRMDLDIPKLEQRCPGVSGMFTQSMPTYGKSTTAHGGQLYESIAVDPCPSMVLFFVLVFSGEDHLRVLFHWLLLLDLDGMTVHAKTVGCSLREAQAEFDTNLGFISLRAGSWMKPCPPHRGGRYLSICLEFLLHLNWSRNGFTPMVGRHYVLFTNCCILMYQNKSPHIVPLWVLFLCKSKGPTGAACGVRGRCG